MLNRETVRGMKIVFVCLALMGLAVAATWYFMGTAKFLGKLEMILAIIFGVQALIAWIMAEVAGIRTNGMLSEIRKTAVENETILSDIQKANATQGQLLGDIHKAEERLYRGIINLEDATRRNLDGFAEIFDRSLWLLNQAEREITLMNFVIRFGEAHVGNTEVAEAYAKLHQGMPPNASHPKTFDAAVERFYEALKEKAGVLKLKLNIVTLTPEAVRESFLKRLANRPGYKHLEQVAEQILRREEDSRVELLGAFGPWRNAEESWLEGDSLPVQVLIAGLPRSGQDRHGCVVFLIGTESVGGQRMARGFYTELNHIIQMYRDMVENVCHHHGFNCRYRRPEKRPPAATASPQARTPDAASAKPVERPAEPAPGQSTAAQQNDDPHDKDQFTTRANLAERVSRITSSATVAVPNHSPVPLATPSAGSPPAQD